MQQIYSLSRLSYFGAISRGCRSDAGGVVSDKGDGKGEAHCGAIENESEAWRRRPP